MFTNITYYINDNNEFIAYMQEKGFSLFKETDEYNTIEVEVEYTRSKAYPATSWEPAEPSEIEIIAIVPKGIHYSFKATSECLQGEMLETVLDLVENKPYREAVEEYLDTLADFREYAEVACWEDSDESVRAALEDRAERIWEEKMLGF